MKFIAIDWTGLDISDRAVPEGEPVLDYPTAWEICKSTTPEFHHEKCSYRVAGMLCDCVGMQAARETIRVLMKRAEPAKAPDGLARREEPQP